MNRKGRVLVIDDNADLLQLIDAMLSASGYAVKCADSGGGGLAEIAAGDFDIAVLDIMMPGMNGVTALMEIKKLAPATEVIMLTAHTSVDTVVECMRVGAFDYILKPFSMAKLESAVEKALEKRRFGEMARAALETAAPSGLLDTVVNYAGSMLGADEALLVMKTPGGEPYLAACAGIADEALKRPRLELCLLELKVFELSGGEAQAVVLPASPAPTEMAAARDLRSALWIPLADGAELMGILVLGRLRERPAFSEDEVRRAKAFGPLFSLIIKKSELNSQLGALRGQLVRSQKMASLGMLAAQITHDFNNLLFVITASVQLMKENMNPGVDRRLSESILQMAREADGLIKQLLLFSRRQVGPPVPADLNKAIDDIKLIIDRLPGKGTAVEYLQAEGLPRVLIKAEHLKQVLLNLAANAKTAMPEGGRLTVSTRMPRAGEALPGKFAGGGCVVLEVADSGRGIPPADLESIFQPFFSTKAEGEGTGLGLYTVQCLVNDCGGCISAANRPEGGAVFRVLLPSAAPGAPAGENALSAYSMV